MLRVSCITHPCSCGCSVPEFWQVAIRHTSRPHFYQSPSSITVRSSQLRPTTRFNHLPRYEYPTISKKVPSRSTLQLSPPRPTSCSLRRKPPYVPQIPNPQSQFLPLSLSTTRIPPLLQTTSALQSSANTP
jgi:hypothetical protein